MIELRQHTAKDSIPECDYVFEKTDKLNDLLYILTPKFDGVWYIVLLEPKIKFVKELIENTTLPKWVNFLVLVSKSKLDEVVLNYPSYAPRERTPKDVINEAVMSLRNLIDESAKKVLRQVYGTNEKDLREMLEKLDRECVTGTISLKQVKEAVNYQKRVYASDVLNAFMLNDYRRWFLYHKLVHDLGTRYSYNALASYSRKLLVAKSKYLNNEDVEQRIVSRVDAPLICYVYTLFENSNNYNQLIGIMYSIDNRCAELMERIQNVNL